MFANIFLLSLLTIIYGTKGDEGGGGRVVKRSTMNFLPELSQQHSNDGDCKYLLVLATMLLSYKIYFAYRFKFHENIEVDKNTI